MGKEDWTQQAGKNHDPQRMPSEFSAQVPSQGAQGELGWKLGEGKRVFETTVFLASCFQERSLEEPGWDGRGEGWDPGGLRQKGTWERCAGRTLLVSGDVGQAPTLSGPVSLCVQ